MSFAGSGGYGPGEKRRKPAQLSSINYNLEDSEILEDLKIINKNKAFSMHHGSKSSNSSSYSRDLGSGGGDSGSSLSSGHGHHHLPPSQHSSGLAVTDIKVEDGKLFYQKRWFRRGQAVLIEPKTGAAAGERYPAMISAIGSDAIWVRKNADNAKVRIYLSQLAKGKFVIKRRAA